MLNWIEYLKIRKELNQKISEKRKICSEEVMNNTNSNYKKKIQVFWKFVNWSIKSTAMNRIETLTDDSGNSYSGHEGNVKIVKAQYTKLGFEVN